MKCDTKTSISKLRSLREELCKKQVKWKEAFQVKDELVEELKLNLARNKMLGGFLILVIFILLVFK